MGKVVLPVTGMSLMLLSTRKSRIVLAVAIALVVGVITFELGTIERNAVSVILW